MNVWAAAGLGALVVWCLGAMFTAGLLWEREHLVQNPEVGTVGWWGSYVLTAGLWPVVLPMWNGSRPASPPQPDEDGYLGAVSQGVYIPPMRTVDTPLTLDQLESLPPGERVFITDKGVTVVRTQQGAFVGWRSETCSCWWNTLGYPVVLCRTHRSDGDPHGEPDESEEEVGR